MRIANPVANLESSSAEKAAAYEKILGDDFYRKLLGAVKKRDIVLSLFAQGKYCAMERVVKLDHIAGAVRNRIHFDRKNR